MDSAFYWFEMATLKISMKEKFKSEIVTIATLHFYVMFSLTYFGENVSKMQNLDPRLLIDIRCTESNHCLGSNCVWLRKTIIKRFVWFFSSKGLTDNEPYSMLHSSKRQHHVSNRVPGEHQIRTRPLDCGII